MKKERKRYIQKKEKKRVYVWLTMEEFARLDANVKKSGLRREPYLRALIEGREVREAPTQEWRKLIGLLSGIGNNLNQLARLSHQTGFYRTRNAVMELLEKLKVIMNEYKKVERRNT